MRQWDNGHLSTMKNIIFMSLMTISSLLFYSCSPNLRYVDAQYQYTGSVNNHSYKILLTLNKEGGAHLQMMEKPVINDLGDLRVLPKFYNEGLYGCYEYDKECACYKVYPYDESWYDQSSLHFVQAIYIGNDGYLYFSTKEYTSKGYIYSDGAYDAKNHTNRGPKYTKL